MTQEGEEPDNTPPRSVIDSAEYRSNRSAVRSPPYSPRSLRNGNGALSVHNDDINGEDADSNIQEGRTSEIGDAPDVCLLCFCFPARLTLHRGNLALMTLRVPNMNRMTLAPLLVTSDHSLQTILQLSVIPMAKILGP